MRLEIETAEMSDDDAMGAVMLLISVRPELTKRLAELTGDNVTITHTVGEVSRTVNGSPDAAAEALRPDDTFVPPADAAFAPPLAGSTADGAMAPGGSSETQALAAAPAAATPDISGVRVDSEGWPHDTRIHSENPTLTVKGTWRQRRFKTDADRKAAEATTHAELRAKGFGVPSAPSGQDTSASAPPASAASPAPVASSPPAPPPAPSATDGGASSPPEPAAIEAASVAAAPAPPPVPASPAMPAELAPSVAAAIAPAAEPAAVNPMVRFTGIMQLVTKAQGENRITQDSVTAILTGLGLGSMRELAARPDLMDGFEATFSAMAA